MDRVCPDLHRGLKKLRTVLLREHVGRVRDGLVRERGHSTTTRKRAAGLRALVQAWTKSATSWLYTSDLGSRCRPGIYYWQITLADPLESGVVAARV